jgi:hypothetical protein
MSDLALGILFTVVLVGLMVWSGIESGVSFF